MIKIVTKILKREKTQRTKTQYNRIYITKKILQEFPYKNTLGVKFRPISAVIVGYQSFVIRKLSTPPTGCSPLNLFDTPATQAPTGGLLRVYTPNEVHVILSQEAIVVA